MLTLARFSEAFLLLAGQHAGMALALVLKRLPQGWRWLRALIILPWAVSPYGAGIFFGYLGRGQTGVGTALSNMFGSSATINLISAQFVMPYLAIGAASLRSCCAERHLGITESQDPGRHSTVAHRIIGERIRAGRHAKTRV